jgi:hypothetical protein
LVWFEGNEGDVAVDVFRRHMGARWQPDGHIGWYSLQTFDAEVSGSLGWLTKLESHCRGDR